MQSIILGLTGFISISSVLIPNTEVYIRDKVEVVKAEVTAYTSSIDETDDTPLITASGSTVQKGTAACPSRLEFGTKVEINGEIYTCEDRMNQRYRDKENYDIWVSHKELAYEFGRQQLEVKIIK